jgi:chromosome segregation ATPase
METLKSIEQKAQLLIEKLGKLEREKAQLSEQVRTLTEQNRLLQTNILLRDSEISHLKTRNKALVETGNETDGRNHHLRKEIDQYMADIDKCIEWLQKS